MALGVRAVDAERHGLDAGGLQRRQAFDRHVGRRRRGERRADPARGRGRDEVLEVRAAERVAAGEDDVRIRLAEAGDPVEEREALVGGQLGGSRSGIAVARQCRQARPQARVVSQ